MNRPLFIGIGNILRGDDAVGSILAQRLKDKLNIIDVAVTPENYLGKIIKENPTQVWIVDALDFRERPGSWRIFKSEELKSFNLFFTHNSSLELFCDYLKKNIQVPIFILGIQPKSVRFGQGLSKEIESAISKIEKKLIDINEGISYREK